jgi:transposase-like protein
MRLKFTQSFDIQAVEKTLTRDKGERIEDIAQSLGIGFSTLQKWIRLSKDQNR